MFTITDDNGLKRTHCFDCVPSKAKKVVKPQINVNLKWECEVCGRRLATKFGLYSHKLQKHLIGVIAPPIEKAILKTAKPSGPVNETYWETRYHQIIEMESKLLTWLIQNGHVEAPKPKIEKEYIPIKWEEVSDAEFNIEHNRRETLKWRKILEEQEKEKLKEAKQRALDEAEAKRDG